MTTAEQNIHWPLLYSQFVLVEWAFTPPACPCWRYWDGLVFLGRSDDHSYYMTKLESLFELVILFFLLWIDVLGSSGKALLSVVIGLRCISQFGEHQDSQEKHDGLPCFCQVARTLIPEVAGPQLLVRPQEEEEGQTCIVSIPDHGYIITINVWPTRESFLWPITYNQLKHSCICVRIKCGRWKASVWTFCLGVVWCHQPSVMCRQLKTY